MDFPPACSPAFSGVMGPVSKGKTTATAGLLTLLFLVTGREPCLGTCLSKTASCWDAGQVLVMGERLGIVVQVKMLTCLCLTQPVSQSAVLPVCNASG